MCEEREESQYEFDSASDGESSLLRRRAIAVYGSFLIRVRVVDDRAGTPIAQADVELNEILTCTSEEPEILKYWTMGVSGSPAPLHLAATTDADGVVFFALPSPFTVAYSPRVALVVSSTAEGYDVRHVRVDYPGIVVLVMMETVTPPVVLSAREVGSHTPSEDVEIRLSEDEISGNAVHRDEE